MTCAGIADPCFCVAEIFEALEASGLSWIGRRTFVKHSYLADVYEGIRADWDKEVEKGQGWNKSNEEWLREGMDRQADAVWKCDEETKRRWSSIYIDDFVEVSDDRKHKDYIDPQRD